jgi:delta-1-pyrroline-5-carboxylate synthetase
LQDVKEAGDKISQSLLERLVLKPQKIQQLADGIRAIAAEEEPIRRVMSRMEVAEGMLS